MAKKEEKEEEYKGIQRNTKEIQTSTDPEAFTYLAVCVTVIIYDSKE